MAQTIEERLGLCKHCLCDTDRYCHTDCHIYSKYCGAVEQKQIDIDKACQSNGVMKPILDACCGGKMFYFDKNDPRVLFQDIRTVDTHLCDGRHFEVKPDVIKA